MGIGVPSSPKRARFGYNAEPSFDDLISKWNYEALEKSKLSESVSKFADWLAERREAIEAHVRHALMRVQSDTLSNALRIANDQCRRLERQREAALLAERNEKVRAASEGASRAVLKAVEGGRRNFHEATRKLKRTSSKVGDWRADVSREGRALRHG